MKKKISCLLLALLLLVQIPLLAAADGGDVATESRSGVVRILMVGPTGSVSTGTGFGVGEVGEETRYFVTNHHVVNEYIEDDSGNIVATYPAVDIWILKNNEACRIFYDEYGYVDSIDLDYSQCVPCEIVYNGDSRFPDMAVIKAVETVPGRVALPLAADDEEIENTDGKDIWALGYPSSSDLFASADYNSKKLVAEIDDVTITKGVVSRFTTASQHGNSKLIQHDAQINHGNSGGPLLNERGVVVGINTYLGGQNIYTGDGNSYYSLRISHMTKVLDDEGIPWESLGAEVNWLLIGILAGVVVLIVVVVVIIIVVSSKNKKPAPVAQPVSQPVAQPVSQPVSTPVQAGPMDTRPRLQCLAGALAGKRFSLENSVRIGRDPNRNDLVVPANTQGISGVHCMLMVEGTTVWLKDLGSTYGTYVAGGRRLGANEAVQLNIGDRFWLGSENELFVIAPKGGI